MAEFASGSELGEVMRRIAALERKVSHLYERVGEAEPGAEELAAGADSDPEVIELVQAGRELEAIKRYRELAGVDLGAAKQAVDRLAATYRPMG